MEGCRQTRCTVTRLRAHFRRAGVSSDEVKRLSGLAAEQRRLTIATFGRIPSSGMSARTMYPKSKYSVHGPRRSSHCSSLDWENFTLEAGHEYGDLVAARDPARWDSWNEFAAELREVLAPLAQRVAHEVARANNLPPVFQECLR